MSTSTLKHFRVQHAQPSDNQLLSEAKSGDQHAFGELCLRHRGMLMSRIYRILRNPKDTEDALQETLLKAYQHLQNFRGTCGLSTWLVAIGVSEGTAKSRILRARHMLRRSLKQNERWIP